MSSIWILVVASLTLSSEITELEDKNISELPSDVPSEALVCQDILATNEAVCSKRLPIRDAIALAEHMITDWEISLSGQTFLTRPYLVTSHESGFKILSKQRPAF